ncbi:MAG TPA: NAD-dependent epimerase/dehydratase family protein [Verrucomicrobiales bacterium]|nr:NAD-dependent epimerase/dehydratase family protein [Verrucomicrobiales bacterium]
MSNFLVTGAAGFIGSEVVRELLAAGHSVDGLDNLDPYYSPRLKRWRLDRLVEAAGDPGALPPWPDPLPPQSSSQSGRFTFHLGNVEDPLALESLLKSKPFDAVFHLAARAGVRLSIAEPARYFQTNVLGAVHLLEAMRRHGPRRLVLASTSSVYAGQPLPFHEDLPVNETLSPYAASKRCAEILAATYHHLHGFDIAVLRYFTVYGPAGRPDMSPLKFTDLIYRGLPIEIYGDGSQRRDFTSVGDIARGTVAASKLSGFHIINLGGNQPVALQDLISLIESLTSRRALLHRKPFNAAEMRDTWADIARAQTLLDWTPLTTLEEGMRRTVAWRRDHPDLLSSSPASPSEHLAGLAAGHTKPVP